jgi:hypothetical protein
MENCVDVLSGVFLTGTPVFTFLHLYGTQNTACAVQMEQLQLYFTYFVHKLYNSGKEI